MRTITYHLLTNQVTESDSVYPNAFSADDNTTQLVFDYTGTACATWDKWLDLTMSDYTKDVQSLGNGAIVTFNLGAEHTKKGLLQVNPYAKNGTDKHGFPIYKLTIERQLNNSVVDASAQQSMIDHFDARLSVKAVNTTTLGAGESATVAITVEDDGTTYDFGVPQGAKGDTGLKGDKGDKGDKGAQWRGAYSAGTAYVVDDVVSYNGSSYICILASTGNLPTNATYWSLLAQKGTDGTNGEVTNASLASTLTAYALKAQEAWITPTLLNSWVAHETGSDAKYQKDQFGRIFLCGALKSGVSNNMFQLPTGYRPTVTRRYVTKAVGASTMVEINIFSSGYVQSLQTGVSVPLDGISFRTD